MQMKLHVGESEKVQYVNEHNSSPNIHEVWFLLIGPIGFLVVLN